jgi:CopG family transcriptional regulator, nickel-responsive regulator
MKQTKENLKRFGVSMENDLLEIFDAYLAKHKYRNRSEAIRDLIRKSLVAEEWDHNRETVGTITLIYDHHTAGLSHKLNSIQHDFGGKVMTSLHIHLDHHHCLEIIVAQGKARRVKALADSLIAQRGVKYGTLTGATSAKELP